MSPIHFSDLDLKQQGYNKWTAYGQSKTANIYLANEIERRYGSQGKSHLQVVSSGSLFFHVLLCMPILVLLSFTHPGFSLQVYMQLRCIQGLL